MPGSRAVYAIGVPLVVLLPSFASNALVVVMEVVPFDHPCRLLHFDRMMEKVVRTIEGLSL